MRVEDWDLWIRMRAEGYRGFNLSETLYKMRDDREAIARRKLKFRFNESRVMIQAIRMLRLSPVNYFLVLRPIVVGLLPRGLYKILHKMKMR